MTNPRTEAVAKAHWADYIEGVEDLEPAWEDLPDDHRDRMISAAQAAEKALIEALMEPTDEMLQAGYRAVWGAAFGNKAVRNGQTHRIFKAMLKAAGGDDAA